MKLKKKTNDDLIISKKLRKAFINWNTPLNKLRWFVYHLTDINANRKRYLSFYFYFAIFYNVIINLIPAIAIFPIIVNFIVNPYNLNQIDYLWKYNEMISRYMYIEYICCFILISDWILRFIYADFKYPFVSNRWKAVLKHLWRLSSLYTLSSIVILIVLFKVYGTIHNQKWEINMNVLGSWYNKPQHLTPNQIKWLRWNPGELIFVSLFITNIFSIIPRVILAFKNREAIDVSKMGFLIYVKQRWKTPVVATIFLIIIFLVFSFLILKTEQTYYSEWRVSHPHIPISDAPGYSSSPKNVWQSLWFCLVTMTTVGYGQIIPQSPAGRIICVFLIIVGITYYSFYTIFFVSIYNNFLDKSDRIKKENQEKLLKQQENKELVDQIQKQLVDHLLELGVVSKENYEKVQQERKEKELANLRVEHLLSNQKIQNALNHKVEKKKTTIVSLFNKYKRHKTLALNNLIQPSERVLNKQFNYEATNIASFDDHNQVIMMKLDTNLIDKIFADDKEKQISVFFKGLSPSFKTNKVVIVNSSTNQIVGEVSLQYILLMSKTQAWKDFGLNSQVQKQFFDVEFHNDLVLSVYFINARSLYTQKENLQTYLTNQLKDELNSSFIYLSRKKNS